ncbi:tRNA (adenosine(37)-N6)-dimethylallyltransferase MiaA [Oceanispirochaeta crateris]|uniref:tRNA (adenosine(37)-N6)-dimethylallyltransferase MiaA n=1 Tax=Oceanispirochaeta crateris TaxID=2518645 RepID=UPI00143CC892|nr:tRNA (adenosine(37)-N6)-dimethylallyltransferase MiaA [Oceanispirochaeta crateris]
MSTNTRSNSPLPPVVCLFGPTAVGKTDLLEELFSDSGEIISADSMQVYRLLNIGSAKPDPSYLQRMPHHLIDILDYTEQFNTGDFVRLAEERVLSIHKRGKLPVISGGTAFYFRNFLFGLPRIPPVSGEIRNALNAELDEKGPRVLHERLTRVDPETAARLMPMDRSRIVRALEVFEGTGKPLSSFQISRQPRNDLSCLLLGLERPRKELYERINERVNLMFERGLYDEIQFLISQGAREDDPGMKGIGYSEFFPFLREGCLTLSDVKDRIQQNSRRYAKRQMTFFRSLPGVSWFNPDRSQEIRERIDAFHRSGT